MLFNRRKTELTGCAVATRKSAGNFLLFNEFLGIRWVWGWGCGDAEVPALAKMTKQPNTSLAIRRVKAEPHLCITHRLSNHPMIRLPFLVGCFTLQGQETQNQKTGYRVLQGYHSRKVGCLGMYFRALLRGVSSSFFRCSDCKRDVYVPGAPEII